MKDQIKKIQEDALNAIEKTKDLKEIFIEWTNTIADFIKLN